jgi:prepilin-type N-terminal cleavage/methylation domain-containing protein
MKKMSPGFSLIEVLVAMAIVGISVTGLISTIEAVQNQKARQQTKWASERVTSTLIDLISLPATIRATEVQPGNYEMYRNIKGRRSAKHLGDWEPVRLFLPFIDRAPDGTYLTGGEFTGEPLQPMRYNDKGDSCDMTLQLCPASQWPIQVSTEYNFSCPPFYHRGYDYKRGGLPYYGPIDDPVALAIPGKCISKAQINIRLVVRESADPDFPASGIFPPRVEIIRIVPGQVSYRVP